MQVGEGERLTGRESSQESQGYHLNGSKSPQLLSRWVRMGGRNCQVGEREGGGGGVCRVAGTYSSLVGGGAS